jgi:hypothetical protein
VCSATGLRRWCAMERGTTHNGLLQTAYATPPLTLPHSNPLPPLTRPLSTPHPAPHPSPLHHSPCPRTFQRSVLVVKNRYMKNMWEHVSVWRLDGGSGDCGGSPDGAGTAGGVVGGGG